MMMLKETTNRRKKASLALTKRLTAWLLMFTLVFYNMPFYAFADDFSEADAGNDVEISESVDESGTEPSDEDGSGAAGDTAIGNENGSADDESQNPADETNGEEQPGETEPAEPSEDETVGDVTEEQPTEPSEDEPAVDDEPADNEPIVDDEPIVNDEPSNDDVANEEQPGETDPADKPTVEDPVVDEPIVDEPTVDEPVVTPEPEVPAVPEVTVPIEQVPVLPEVDIIANAVQMMAAPVALLEEEPVCICEYRCSPAVTERTWQGNVTYVNCTDDCPVCGGEDGDWQNSCQGLQVVADGDPEHEHTWATGFGVFTHIEPNCTTPEAWTLLDMQCGAEWLFAFNYDTDLNPDNHYFSDYKPVIIEATCAEDGSKTNTCLLCGEEIVEVIPALGHEPDEATISIVEPTCTEDGSKTALCTVCGEEYVEVIPAAGHKLDDNAIVTVEATCTTEGSKVGHCDVCGEDVVIEITKALGHDYIEEVTQAATCTEAGSKTTSCSRGDYLKVDTLPAFGHQWPVGINVPDSLNGICTECGVTAYWVCTYEEGATPSGSGWEMQICARVMQEKDGTVYIVDAKGNRLPDADFEVVINQALMGKNKTHMENGVAVMTKVVGYRNVDQDNSPIYKEGDRIAAVDVPNMYVDERGSMANYQSVSSHKFIFLGAVREKMPTFGPNPEVPVDPNKPVTPEVPEVPVVPPVQPEVPTFAVNKVPYGATLQDNMVARSGLAATSAGITTDFAYNDANTTCVITYTIPADFTGTSVNIDATDDVMQAYQTIQDRRFGHNGSQPGDTLGPVYIRMVNLSGRTLAYDDGSIVLQSTDYSGYPAYINPIYTFDGSVPDAGSVPSRVSNGALRFLYGVTTDLGAYELSDEVLGETLRSRGYANGVADLHQYYLDYYNNFYSDGNYWQSLSEVPFELLTQRDEGIFGGQSSAAGLKETNPEVAGVGFSFFYTRLMSVIPGNSENLKDFAGDYAVGNYMKHYVSYNDNAKAVWGELAAGADAQLDGMSIYINGEANDFYQNTAWGIEVGFSFSLLPNTPDNPSDDGGDDPTPPPTPTTNIDEPPVPLTERPNDEEYIFDDEVPLAEQPVEEEVILDEEVPLAQVPKTGDNLILWFFATAISGIAGLVLARKRS